MISRKRTQKLIRLIICFAVIIAASSMFLTIEPMASENSNAQAFSLPAQEEAVIEVQALRACAAAAPVTPYRLALQPLSAVQSVDASDIEAVLAALPAEADTEGSAIEDAETAEDTETASDADIWYEFDSDWDQDSEMIYEEAPVEEIPAVSTPETSESNQESSTPAETPASGGSASYSDLDYLAAICQIEAGYNYEGCLAVANVILNRVNAGFAGSVYDVIYQPYQFATGWMNYYLENGTSSTAREAAAAALAGSNNIGSYLYFNGTTWLNPETLGRPYVVIGGNVFY